MVEGDERLLFGRNTYELGGHFRLPGWNWVNEGWGAWTKGILIRLTLQES